MKSIKHLLTAFYGVALLASSLWLSSCIEPIEIETEDGAKLLVVDGLITTSSDSVLNRVVLSRTEAFKGASEFVVNEPVDNATVWISDSRGYAADLEFIGRGEYRVLASRMKGFVGTEYTLHITTPDGKKYISSPERILPVVAINNLSYKYKEFINVVVNGSGDRVEKKTGGFEISAEANDPELAGNYYRWDSRGTFEYFTRPPELFDWPSQCWFYLGKIDKKVTVQDDDLINGRRFQKAILTVPFDRPTKYKVEIRQFSLTRQAYNFWRLFEEQQESVGSVFDPPPALIRGNIVCVSNPKERVIGYFGASDVREQYIVIDRGMYVPMPGVPHYIPNGDCRVYLPGGTSIRPVGM